MFETPLMKRLGVTPAKLALIGVLAVVLLVVIVIQWPSSAQSPPAVLNAVNATEEDGAARGSVAPPTADQQSPRSQVVWPELTLAEIVQHDPFQLPVHLRPNPVNESKPKDSHDPLILQTLTEAEEGMILMVGNEHVARVGAKTLRPGDKIGSYRVSKIDATGIWLVDEDNESK